MASNKVVHDPQELDVLIWPYCHVVLQSYLALPHMEVGATCFLQPWAKTDLLIYPDLPGTPLGSVPCSTDIAVMCGSYTFPIRPRNHLLCLQVSTLSSTSTSHQWLAGIFFEFSSARQCGQITCWSVFSVQFHLKGMLLACFEVVPLCKLKHYKWMSKVHSCVEFKFSRMCADS